MAPHRSSGSASLLFSGSRRTSEDLELSTADPSRDTSQDYDDEKPEFEERAQERTEEERGLLDERTPDGFEGSTGEDLDDRGLEPDDASYPPGRKSPSNPGMDPSALAFAGQIAAETVPSLMFALTGGIATGELLQQTQSWSVFMRVEELYILVPIIMNLKGNLEMNLACRLSTSANIGDLDVPATRRALILGNLALLQVQALLVSLLASLLSFLLGLLSRNNLPSISHLPGKPGQAPSGPGWRPSLRGSYFECVMVLCAGMLAASWSSAILGSFMCGLIVVSRKFGVNPDNIATPVAASLGDLFTLLILSGVATILIKVISTIVSSLLLLALIGSAAFYVHLTYTNRYVRSFLWTGWLPLLLAMVISCGTGLVLENFVSRWEGFGLLASTSTMIAGNSGAIYASRLSTALHSRRQEPRKLVSTVLFTIGATFLAGLLAFTWATGQVRVGWALAAAIMSCCCLNIAFGLFLAQWLCDYLWSKNLDPDTHAIPLLSSLCDVSGQLLLVAAFTIVSGTTDQKVAAGA